MGLLYGKGDPDQTIIISTRCGQDSDCNPSNAAGVLFTTIGFSKLPARFTSELDPQGKFSHTPYDFPTLIDVSKKLVRQALERSGGHIEKATAARRFSSFRSSRRSQARSKRSTNLARSPRANSRPRRWPESRQGDE